MSVYLTWVFILHDYILHGYLSYIDIYLTWVFILHECISYMGIYLT